MDYLTIDRICTRNDSELSAAEAHGMATGMLCTNEQASNSGWLTELFGEDRPGDGELSMLLALFEQTGRLLASDQFDFELFLPDENARLSERASALVHWCHGFLFGFGAGMKDRKLSGDAEEILRDIYEFTRMDTRAEGDEDESAFVEITEYVKAAVLLLRDEMASKSKRLAH